MSSKFFVLVKIQSSIVDFLIKWLNFWLSFFQEILFKKLKSIPQNILIYKIGNIGDIVCVVPALIAIRRFYPNSKITLLTSPGEKGVLGAKELLSGAWYLDNLETYYAEDIDSLKRKINFAKKLRENKYDLFIQLPDDLVNFRTLFRNMIFTKLIGAKSAFGFKIRTIQLFKKTQVDHLLQETEVESLLNLLRENSIGKGKIEYDFNISEQQKKHINDILNQKFGNFKKSDIIVAISAGGKKESNQWPRERFKEVVEYLCKKYNAKIVIIGGGADVFQAKVIAQNLENKDYLIAAGEIGILETIELLKRCSFLISNSTGTIHLATAVGLPAIGIYGVRDVFGRWFPYGQQHKILYHKFIDCNYKKEECIKRSIELISVEEVISVCERIIKEIKLIKEKS